MQLPFVTLDVFTSKRFEGNPVAIVKVPTGTNISQLQKQHVAKEFNLSETVFLHEQTDKDLGEGAFRVDIFTAIAEVPFAGHPVTGTANYLLHYLKDSKSKALITKAGRIPFHVTDNGVQLQVAHNVHIHSQPFASQPFGHYPVVSIVKGMTFILAQLPTLEDLSHQTQNLLGPENTYTSHEALDPTWQAGIVTTFYYVDLGLSSEHSPTPTRLIRTRMFGSREDPATGSASSALCCYLTLTQKPKANRATYHLTQGVEMNRESHIFIEVTLTDDGNGIKEVLLSGTAVKVMEGSVEM
ncbi:putative phenazine biosynthesis protein [Phaeomoniella chlamydospora]|uniref:Putative phenazine biosynthesis protein n=1 Tax=Phaeomoniella chlamydospora TaxID=158046 RepID=A0A0G2G2Q1_PHACM|nr:putative phenazine biosynthesis protein [Phaeomoniella chlamydospora]